MPADYALRLAASRRFLTADDVRSIQALVPREGPCRVIDLGAGSGTTALAVFDVRPDAVVTTVDIDMTALDWAGLAIRNAYPDATWIRRHCSALQAATFERPNLLGRYDSFDLVLHDASHEEQQVRSDLLAYAARTGGRPVPLWVHDYRPPPPDWDQPPSPGVKAAIDRLVAEGIIEGAPVPGLGWAGRFLP